MKNFLTNWKTSGAAALLAILGILNIIYPATFTTALNVQIIGVLGALGFAVAKDGNVTGGSVKQ